MLLLGSENQTRSFVGYVQSAACCLRWQSVRCMPTLLRWRRVYRVPPVYGPLMVESHRCPNFQGAVCTSTIRGRRAFSIRRGKTLSRTTFETLLRDRHGVVPS